jgi:hypothetical protein
MSDDDSGDDSENIPLPKSEAQRSGNSSPLPLDYAPPPKPKRREKVSAAVLGALLTILVVGVISAFAWAYPGPLPARRRGTAVLFLGLTVFAFIATAIFLRRRPLRPSGWFVAGMLIGLGIIGLLEGACWSAS